jgi:hypothetical protein
MPRFYTFGLIAAVAIAWLAAFIHRSGHAPLGLTSAGVGFALATVAATLRLGDRRRVLIGTFVLAAIVVIAQHAWLYENFRREWREARQNSPQAAMFRDESPWTPWEYMKHEATPRRVALWCIDAVLITVSAVTTVWMITRRAQAHSAWRPTPKS